jgi:hypothetical protein
MKTAFTTFWISKYHTIGWLKLCEANGTTRFHNSTVVAVLLLLPFKGFFLQGQFDSFAPCESIVPIDTVIVIIVMFTVAVVTVGSIVVVIIIIFNIQPPKQMMILLLIPSCSVSTIRTGIVAFHKGEQTPTV